MGNIFFQNVIASEKPLGAVRGKKPFDTFIEPTGKYWNSFSII